MDNSASRVDALDDVFPTWRQPHLNAVRVADITALGKLGSLDDMGDMNYAPD